ncbi:sulfite exporter TauE/SafE family protein [Litoreibacter halocynthiae]|uniref:sulfite exporter TauE/SafE family protein n=1 Tax=Litoreibacter halocynthiae TaxID=1242689 RepID=UPI0024929B76|nr:sulfite exporter TauE/SafE family protein [Litoreibacter halocynthiae]
MTLEFFAILALGAAAGGFMNGLAGFGTALFALGFWLQIMPPAQAVSIVVIMSVIAGLQGVWLVRASIMDQPRRLARFVLPALVGVPLGVAALSVLEPGILKLIIAGFLILYGGFFTLRSSLPKLERPTPAIDMLVGFAGGVLGGAASLSGALPTMWCAMRPWPKSETRAVLQPFNVIVLGVTALVFAINGTYTGQTLTYIAMALPVTMIFAQIGISVFKRLTDDQFRRLLIAMMLVSGLVLMAREVF